MDFVSSERPRPKAPPLNSIRTVDVIRKKRDGHELSRAEIDHLVSGYTAGEIPDYQVSAWLMAALLRGLSRAETAALTDAMLHSGQVLDLSEFAAPKIDKHSTGGVGDKTSLVLAAVGAAGGLVVPMISGRGLGHTGGTLDKLESIPGFQGGTLDRAFPRSAASVRLRDDRPDGGNCSSRPLVIFAARCDRHGGKPLPDLRLDHEQKAGGRN